MKKLLSSSAVFALVLLLLLGTWLQPNEAGRMLITGKKEDQEAVRAKYQLSGLLAFHILQKGQTPPPGNDCRGYSGGGYTCIPGP
ncbi:hypothetical protein NL676_002775 [Syzygium grande]|nr:hypothetical protein NL676_002775 [Syzygium grande]